MNYSVFYHHKVKEEDLPAIDRMMRDRIFRAIELRLLTEPEKYGQPLRKPLKNYWKLRVGDYRVIYKIVRNEIWVLAILHRDKAYEVMSRGR